MVNDGGNEGKERIDVQTNVDITAAIDALLAFPAELRTETVPLASAFGRVLAEAVYAQTNVPSFDRSPYDGYAFRSADTLKATKERPVSLRITEEIPAGSQPRATLTSGFAAKILTGAPLPRGADAVVKFEECVFSDTEVKIFRKIAPDTDVAHAGEGMCAGRLIAARGARITAPVAGMLAEQGQNQIAVYKKPSIAVLSTGSELAVPGEPLSPAKIYDSNFYTISSCLSALGAEPVNFGIVRDDPDEIAARLSSALEAHDMVITTGGVSVGDYDWLRVASEKIGARGLFWKLNMKPGGSMLASEKGGKLILSLSGNPGAAVLAFLMVARPCVLQLCGCCEVLPERIEVLLKEPFGKKSPRVRILRGRLKVENGFAYFVENEGQGNGVISSFDGCDLLGEIPAGSPPLRENTVIKAYRI